MKFDFLCLGYYYQCCNKHDNINTDLTAFIIIMVNSIGWLEDGRDLKVKKYILERILTTVNGLYSLKLQNEHVFSL